jgi:hypothetical protein
MAMASKNVMFKHKYWEVNNSIIHFFSIYDKIWTSLGMGINSIEAQTCLRQSLIKLQKIHIKL